MISSTLKKLSLLTAITLTVGCAGEKQDTGHFSNTTDNSAQMAHIIGGTESDQKFQNENGLVGLLITESSIYGRFQSICTGTLIQRDVILTAAHCVMPSYRGSRISVLAFFTNNIENISVSNAVYAMSSHPHEDYLKDITNESSIYANWNDIAIVRLQEEAPKHVKLAKLASSKNEVALQKQSSLTLAGYGITTPVIRKEETNVLTGEKEIIELESSGSGLLRQVSGVPVTFVDAKKKQIRINQRTSQKGIYKGACHGDSGGPAFVTAEDGSLVQVGVTSRGTENLGNCNRGAIYTGVQGHEKWINGLLAEFAK